MQREDKKTGLRRKGRMAGRKEGRKSGCGCRGKTRKNKTGNENRKDKKPRRKMRVRRT